MVLPFVDIHPQPHPESDEALAVSCSVPREKHTHIARSLFPVPSHTSIVRRFIDFSDVQTPSRDSLKLRAPQKSGQTTTQLWLVCILLVFCEILFNALHSGKKPSTFMDVHYKKQPHKNPSQCLL